MSGPADTITDTVRDRSIRLFSFLLEVEKFRATRIHNLAAYGSTTPPGTVVWIGDLPNEPEIRTVLKGSLPHDSEALLEVSRTDLPTPPDVPPELSGRVGQADSTDPTDPPQLLPNPQTGETADADAVAFQRWLRSWQVFAQEAARVHPIRDLYRRLFRIYEQLDQNPEDLEAVIAAGCLSWQPDNHAGVQRHLTVMSAHITFDADSGLITVQLPSAREVALELDMLDPKRHPRHSLVEDVESRLAELDTSILDQEAVTTALRIITHGLSDEAVYHPDDTRPHTISSRPHVGFAPAFIVRRRSNERRLRVLADIIAALEDKQHTIPEGVASIVVPLDLDANEAQLDPETDLDDADAYLPLAANRAQQEIVWSVEHRRHTVVQGPPGTGKTHTIANVLSHLLATGRRVLITAHTERALKEVREKLPDPLRDLVIAVTGQSRDEKAALERSVRQMTAFVDSYQKPREHKRIQDLEDGLDQLRRQQARIRTELVQARVNDVETTTIGVYHGTPAKIAQQLADHASKHDWLEDSDPPQHPPLAEHERQQLLDLLRREDLHIRADEIEQPLPDLKALPTPDKFAALVETAEQATHRADDAKRHQQHLAHQAFAALDDQRRRELAVELRAVADDVRLLQSRPEAWVENLLSHLSAGKSGVWEQRAEDLEATLAPSQDLIRQVGSTTIRAPEDLDCDQLLAQAQTLRAHLADGGNVRRVFNARPVREAAQLLETTTVDGAPPKDLDRLDAFVAWAKLSRQLDRADTLWPATVEIPPEDTFNERLAWHRTELNVLIQTLTTGRRLTDLHHELTQARIPEPDWMNAAEIRQFADVAEEPDLRAALHGALQPLEDLLSTLTSGRTGPQRQQLRQAVAGRNVTSYRAAHEATVALRQLRADRDERDGLLAKFTAALPNTAEQLTSHPNDPAWAARFAQLEPACAWGWARSELHRRLADDHTDDLMRQLEDVGRTLRVQVLQLTVARSWAHAVDRLDEQQRRRLNTYALLAKKLPKGGKYRARKLRELQEALRLCRDAVPAWIMPINYVADVLEVDPNAFDVVIVDEASQAGMDATFLQYLAPKMIVIGDDLQVSPTAFVNRSELHRLADDLLHDFEDKPLWEDPETSLFDHATNRFGKRITLIEHFRCMPEIIGFSQRYVYEPNGVKLVPLRQYGAERLTPIRTHHVPDGYRVGKLNPPEVDALVELVAKCNVDPLYDVREHDGTVRKRTFGVISMTGADQAKQIDQALLDHLGERDYAEREVRCGDAADFQGSQREVIFLSFVDAPPPDGSRIPKRGDKATDQRVNVAASRAQDQMWLVHSVLPEHLHPEGIRTKLLTYCLATERQFGNLQHAVPQRVDDHLLDTDRFDSLFEQHVFNRIVDRNYVVQPQVDVHGYRIDLVIVGQESNIAVECDGDEWHGPDRYQADIARQRDLERADWTFFRVRGSKFYADPEQALQQLWELLESHGIYPVTPRPSEGSPPTPLQLEEREPEAPEQNRNDSYPAPTSVDDTPVVAGGTPLTLDRSLVSEVEQQEPHVSELTTRANDRSNLEALDPGPTRPSRSGHESVTHDATEEETDINRSRPEPARPKLEQGLDLTAATATLAAYRSWDTSALLPDPSAASPAARRDAILKIVEVEGPVVGTRLYQLYVKSAGGSKVGSSIRRTLDRATYSAVVKGDLVVDNPLAGSEEVNKTFRLPSQPDFTIRELGDRTIHEVPPIELAALLYALRRPADGEEPWFRRVLDAYGLIKLTTVTRDRLRQCAALFDNGDG